MADTGKIRRLSGREVLKILVNNGFKRLSSSGGHVRMGKMKDGKYYATTVQVSKNELKTWTILKIIQQSGKPPEEFR